MAIVGFNFNKITAEKKSAVKGKIKINNNVSIKDVSSMDFSIGSTKQKGLKYGYEFTAKFEPNLGSIVIQGDVLSLEEASKVDEILKQWKKSKKVGNEFMVPIMNTILSKCNIKALILSQDLNLPAPLQMPRVKAK
ncbi:hypothetical protein ACFLZ7_02675 [Nanoarchaeota archaeon]